MGHADSIYQRQMYTKCILSHNLLFTAAASAWFWGGKIFSEHELLSLLPRVNKERYFTQNFIYHQD